MLTTAPTRQAVTRDAIAEFLRQGEDVSRRRPRRRLAPVQVTEWTLIRARLDAWATIRRIRHGKLMAAAEVARAEMATVPHSVAYLG